jgi:hypothetical protein
MNEVADGSTGNNTGLTNPVERISNAQVFAHDPEAHTPASLDLILERLRPIIAKQRKARDDEATVLAQQALVKKRKKKVPKDAPQSP